MNFCFSTPLSPREDDIDIKLTMVRSKKVPRGGGAVKSNGRGQGRRGRGGGRGGGGGDGGRRHVEDDDGADFIPFSGASKPASHPQGQWDGPISIPTGT